MRLNAWTDATLHVAKEENLPALENSLEIPLNKQRKRRDRPCSLRAKRPAVGRREKRGDFIRVFSCLGASGAAGEASQQRRERAAMGVFVPAQR
jgi:hypothetical protein